MVNLKYFRIGFISDNAIDELEKIKKKKEHNLLLIEDAYNIINSLNSVAKNKNLEDDEVSLFYNKLIYGDLEKLNRLRDPEIMRDIKERLSNIEIAKFSLEDLLRGNEVSYNNIDITIKILEYVGDKCKQVP